MASANGKRSSWRLIVSLPEGYALDAPALFGWLREWLIPALLEAPFRVTLEFKAPDDDRSDR